MKVKLCGFTEQKSVELACSLGCDFIGVVFVKKSPRYISPLDSSGLGAVFKNYKNTQNYLLKVEYIFLTKHFELIFV